MILYGVCLVLVLDSLSGSSYPLLSSSRVITNYVPVILDSHELYNHYLTIKLQHNGTTPDTQTNHLNPSTSDAIGQSSLFLGALYLALKVLINSTLPAAGPWAVVGKTFSYLVKLGPIMWWAMLVPTSAPPSPEEASRYSWYPDIC
ncbi:hypothetical protein DSO57_1013025 [Entomophthora muscae]|uniref:Uncharacterized protein n=1 Tax=Entomophthora muscae TaxID=34485 RepID=A0ACC2RKJ5_9FUNG|nr:hypothetical protein DSO57_1013025 [Entomophthora muscae]